MTSVERNCKYVGFINFVWLQAAVAKMTGTQKT